MRDAGASTQIRQMASSASRTQKQSPSNFTSGALKTLQIPGPTSNLRNLAGQLLMSSGQLGLTRGVSLNDTLIKKNTDLQASV